MSCRRLTVLTVVVVVTVMAGGAGSASGLATCANTDLVPRFADLVVSQGAPGYTRLARGKDTVVRAYLTTPDSCTPAATQFITPRSATLAVTNNDGAQPQLSTSALSGNLGPAAQVVSPSDPLFLVPRGYLAPTATNADGTATVTFMLTVTYDRTGATGQTVSTTKTVAVDKNRRAVRILVVPLGDPSNTKTVQWSPAAQNELTSILSNTARAFPVPSGTGDLSSAATGGVRYVISGGLLDVKSLNLYKSSGGKSKFCASGANWSMSQVTSGAFAGHTLKGDLLQRLQNYNDVNNPPADLVLGVVDGAIAWKSGDGLGCDDGRAAVPAAKAFAQVAWVRVADYAAGDPANYPSPVQMELMHPFGIVNPAVSITYHSPNVESDAGVPAGTGTDKAYNVLQLKPISTASGALGLNDHSIMNYNTTSIPFTKDNSALEPRDWSDALCNLGGVDSATAVPFANCTLNSAVGTSAGVAAGNTMFGISGIIGTGGPRVTDSGIVAGDSTVPIGLGESTSPLHLLACTGDCSAAGNVQHDFPLAVYGDEGHADEGEIDVTTLSNGFGAVVPVDTAWTDFALRYNGSIVYSASESSTPPDVLTTSTSTPFLLREFSEPACCNGRAVAFDGSSLYTTVANPDVDDPNSNTKIYKLDTNGRLLGTIDTSGNVIGALAFDPATRHLYAGDYTRPTESPNGTGKVFELDPSTRNPEFVQLFDPVFSDPDCPSGLGPSIDGLEWLGDKFAVSGDVCTTVFLKTKTGGALSSFSTEPNSGITTDGAGGLWLAILQTVPGATKLVHTNLSGAVDQSFTIDSYQAEDLAYDSVTFAPSCAVWMNEATLGTPSIRAYQVPCGGPAPEPIPPTVTFTATNARYGTAYFTCGDPTNVNDEKFPIADGLDPVATQGVVQTFTFYWSSTNLSCGEGTPKVLVSVSDGFTRSPLTDTHAQLPVTSSSKSPFTAISAPMGQYPEKGLVHFEGIAWDPEQGELTGAALKWSEGTTQIGTGKSFERTAAGPGVHTVKLDATDAQGHTTSDQTTYLVLYSSGPCLGDPGRTVLQPVNPDGSSVFKKGSTVSVKFRVCDADGHSIGTPGTILPTSSPLFKVPSGCAAVSTPSAAAAPVFCATVGSAGGVDETVVSTAADTSFRWDATLQQWVFNQGTSNLTAGVKYKYYIPLNDGTYIFYVFGVK